MLKATAWSLGTEPGPLKEQAKSLTAGPSLQPHNKTCERSFLKQTNCVADFMKS